MTHAIRITPTETPAERKLAAAHRLVDEIRTKRDKNESSTRDDMNAALARRKAAQEVVDRERSARQ
jgi:hypothetical protein